MQIGVVVKKWSAWAPGLETSADWQDWARGKKQPVQSSDWPALGHLEAMFKRRLSQLTRMVLQVGHDLMPEGTEVRVVFASHYGEINQQYKISRGLIDTNEVAPAAFSLSVFNTPVALLSIAEKNHGYSSALYGGPASFATACMEALALLKSDPSNPVLLLIADELLPEDYQPLALGRNQPYAFGLLLAADGEGTNLAVSTEPSHGPGAPAAGITPDGLAFLSWYLSTQPEGFHLTSQGLVWVFRKEV